MKRYCLFNENRSIRAEVLPEFGGVISSVRLNGSELIWFDEEMLGLGNVLAGGIPLLFPFAGKTKDNEMKIGDRVCCMPMHGFMTWNAFDVVSASDNSIELRYQSDMSDRHFYPFAFALTLRYRLEGDILGIEINVRNLNDGTMHVALGLHPYFRTTDKARTQLDLPYVEYDDYMECGLSGAPRRGRLLAPPRVSEPYDHVLWGADAGAFLFCNEADGYCVRLIPDESFRVVTLSTRHDGSACIEPWQALPNAANHSERCQRIESGCEKTFSLAMVLTQYGI